MISNRIIDLDALGYPRTSGNERYAFFRIDFNGLSNLVFAPLFADGPAELDKEFKYMDGSRRAAPSEVVAHEGEFGFFLGSIGGTEVYVQDRALRFAFTQIPLGLGWLAIEERFLQAPLVNHLRDAHDDALLAWPNWGLTDEEIFVGARKLGLPAPSGFD